MERRIGCKAKSCELLMDGITIGAIGAATIAAIVSILGLIIGKEQKTSEFRQAWINDLRKCFIEFLAEITSISDNLRTNGGIDSLRASYTRLNQAYHGIVLRLNETETESQKLINALKKFEEIASDNNTLTPDKIKEAENLFIEAAKAVLKFEWKRVKKGEKTFVYTKWCLFALLAILLIILSSPIWGDLSDFFSPRAPKFCEI